MSAPNFAKRKRMEQAEDSSPDPSSSACEIRNQPRFCGNHIPRKMIPQNRVRIVSVSFVGIFCKMGSDFFKQTPHKAIHNTSVLWIALCGPKRIRTLRVQYTLSPVYFAITYKHAGKVFESSRKASHALLWVHAIKKDFLRKSLFYTRGPKRIRTPRLLSANEALYQMSYGPNFSYTDAKQMYAL